jgi:hypothetical protein
MPWHAMLWDMMAQDMLHAEYFQNFVHAIGEIDIFTFFGPVLYEGSRSRGLLLVVWRGLNGKCRYFVRDLNFWPALHTPHAAIFSNRT